MRSNVQIDLRRYVASRFYLDSIRITDVGDSRIRVTDSAGDTMELTCNVFGDVMEVQKSGKPKILAESDLPHNLDQISTGARPKSWQDIPY